MRRDVNRMEAFIKLGSLIYDFKHRVGSFYRNWLSQDAVEAMHEAYFNLPDGIHQEETIIIPDEYKDPIDKILPRMSQDTFLGPPD